MVRRFSRCALIAILVLAFASSAPAQIVRSLPDAEASEVPAPVIGDEIYLPAPVLVAPQTLPVEQSQSPFTINEVAGPACPVGNCPVSGHSNDHSSATCPAPNCDCKKMQALSKAVLGAYKNRYFDNDFSFLCDPCYDDWHLGEHLKRIGIGDCWIADVGGEFRHRFHHEGNLRTRPLTGISDDFQLMHTRLYLNAEYGDGFRFYGEAIDAVSFNERHAPRTTDTNRFDALNLFIDARLAYLADSELWTRVGRQEMQYGAQRLVSPLDWSNTRRTFDGAMMTVKSEAAKTDAFWMRPVNPAQHAGDDSNFDNPDNNQEFMGFYHSQKLPPGEIRDFYGYRGTNWSGTQVNANGRMGDFDANIIAAYMKGKYDSLLWELEGGYQFGSFAGDEIRAGFFVGGVGHKFTDHCWTPELWLYYDYASGDANPNDDIQGTFNTYFPLGHKYFGFTDVIGRQNIQDLNVQLTMQFSPKWKGLLWWHCFWLAETRDAVYGTNGVREFRDPTGGSGRYVGQDIDFVLFYQIAPRMEFSVGYSHFFTGEYFDSPVIQGPPAGGASNGANGQDGTFIYTQLILQF